jgi:hypothetical protein
VSAPVSLALKSDEALVLFEFLQSGDADLAAAIKRQPGAWSVVNAIVCGLEKQLVEPFLEGYARRVEEARASVIVRHGAQPED